MNCNPQKPTFKCYSTNTTVYKQLEKIVDDYNKCDRPIHDGEMKWFAKATNLAECIKKATCSLKENGKMHSHQCRIGKVVLGRAYDKLKCCEVIIEKTTSFENLYKIVYDAIIHIRGVGDLTVYDIAERIAAYRGVVPETIYLHAGPRITIRKLGFRNTTTITIKNLVEKYPEFSALETASHIENCLCIYKEHIINWKIRIA